MTRLVLVTLLLSPAMVARAVAKHCDDKDAQIEQLETQLRLRAAELIVVRSQLRAANKRLERCVTE